MSVGDISSFGRNFAEFFIFVARHSCEFFFERSRRNAEHAKPRQVVRGYGVDLRKLDLIAGEVRGGYGNISATPAIASHKANSIRISKGRKPAAQAMVRNIPRMSRRVGRPVRR